MRYALSYIVPLAIGWALWPVSHTAAVVVEAILIVVILGAGRGAGNGNQR